jgi:hypothetical protein
MRREHTIVWEASQSTAGTDDAEVAWPNRFSEFIGDKTYGLVVADTLGYRVPRTRVLGRNVAAFEFGQKTGTHEWYTRTAPRQRSPGRFTTAYQRIDAFELLQREDPQNNEISAVLQQEAVDAVYSGATTLLAGGGEIDKVEGVAGRGENFMLGQQAPEDLPDSIVNDVRDITRHLRKEIGSVTMEWVHDGEAVWIVQLHRAHRAAKLFADYDSAQVRGWVTFRTSTGVEALRMSLKEAESQQFGIEVIGDFGVTSHIGELLAQSTLPKRRG